MRDTPQMYAQHFMIFLLQLCCVSLKCSNIISDIQLVIKYRDITKYNIDDAPKEVKKLFGDEIVKLYAAAVRNFFQCASNRDSYREGVALLRKLIRYGGTEEAEQIATEQKSRIPRRPALIDELSKL